MISFNWQYNLANQYYILSFTFHPNEKPHDNVWVKKGVEGITWVPSHLEQGQIGELLALANRINGLPRRKRERLRSLIDCSVKEDFEFKLTRDNIALVVQAFKKVEGIFE